MMETENMENPHSSSPSSPFSGQPVGLGLGLEQSLAAQSPYSDGPSAPTSFAAFDGSEFLSHRAQQQHQNLLPHHQFAQQPASATDPSGQSVQSVFEHKPHGAADAGLHSSHINDNGAPQFPSQSQPNFLTSADFGGTGADLPLYPQSSPGPHEQQFGSLFDTTNLGGMASPQSQVHHSPTPPHMLGGDPGSRSHSAATSPSFAHFNGGHSRNVSLGPEAAMMQNHIPDWNRPQFQSHRRSISEYSDISSAVPSPNMVTHDSFDDQPGHSPLQQASDPSMIMGIGNFTLSDHGASPSLVGRSPSHSPVPSPRMMPQSMGDMNPPHGFGLGVQNGYMGGPTGYSTLGNTASEAFPSLRPSPRPAGSETPQMAPPIINVDFAPSNTRQTGFELSKTLNQDSLTPPDRGRPTSRRRAVTDPYSRNASVQGGGHLSPQMSPDMSGPPSPSRSLSPMDRQSGTSPSRRRQSTSAVPNNVMALRLADPEYTAAQEAGGPKKTQKHPATFQCHLCPKRFTRAYNLRSHLRTHTDERPFVCTVCGKAFARQHDRKRHESLHSGEKKFVCKGELKNGGTWGCGRRFARADALGRHFRSESGRACIASLLREESDERTRQWHEQHMQQMGLAPQPPMGMEGPPSFGMDTNYGLPAALLAQYPALAQVNFAAMGSVEDDGRSFDASDYEEGDDTGYVSGPGAFAGEQSYGEMGYASDYSGR